VPPLSITFDELNAGGRTKFIAALGGIFENAPWVAERAYGRCPFTTVAELHAAMLQAVNDAGEAAQLDLIYGHPELAGQGARASDMTEESRREQGGAGLERLSEGEFAHFERLNATYRERFGFPFIICVRRHTHDSVILPTEAAERPNHAQARYDHPRRSGCHG
jgi:2-oxo-4-hydroxy-4-carboxy-5-ureidoimidazoline decarboxylase